MKRLSLILALLFAFVSSALATDITVQALTVPNAGFQVGQSRTGTCSATNASTTVTFTGLPANLVGLSGYKIVIGGIQYQVAATTSTTSLTLTIAYQGTTSASAAYTLYPVVELRVFSDSTFQPNGQTYVVQTGNRNQPNTFYKRIGCSVISGQIVIPSVTLDATTDCAGFDPNTKPYSAFWFLPGGGPLRVYDGFDAFKVSHATTNPTWAAIWQYNHTDTRRIPYDTSGLTSTQTLALVEGFQSQLDTLQATQYLFEDYGAVADAQTATATIASGGTTLTATTSVFVPADVAKKIYIMRATTGGIGLFGSTIATYVSPTTVTIADATQAAATSQTIYWGTDNTTAINNTIQAAGDAGGGRVTGAVGNYLCSGSIVMNRAKVAFIVPPKGAFQIWSAVHTGAAISSVWTPNSSNSANVTISGVMVKVLDVWGFQAGIEDKGGTFVDINNTWISNAHYPIVLDQTEIATVEKNTLEGYSLTYHGATRNTTDPQTSGLGWTRTACGTCATDGGGRWAINSSGAGTPWYYRKALGTDMFDKGFTILFRTPEYASGSGKQSLVADNGTYRYVVEWQSSGTNVKLNSGATRTASLSGINRLEIAPGGATAILYVDGTAGASTAGIATATPTGITWGDIGTTGSGYYWHDISYWSASPIPAAIWLVSGPDWDATYTGTEYTNRITIADNQINATSDGIVDDGGYGHIIRGNNINSGLRQLWLQGPYSVTVENNSLEAPLHDAVWIAQTTKQGSTRGNAGAHVSFRDNMIGGDATAGFYNINAEQVNVLSLENNYFPRSTGFAVQVDHAGAAGFVYETGTRTSGAKVFEAFTNKYPYIYSLTGDPTADVRVSSLYRLQTRKLSIFSDSDDATGTTPSNASIYFWDQNGSNRVRVVTPDNFASDRTQTFQDVDGTIALQSGSLTPGWVPYATTGGILTGTSQMTYALASGLTLNSASVTNVATTGLSATGQVTYVGAVSQNIAGGYFYGRINVGATNSSVTQGVVGVAENQAATSGGTFYGGSFSVDNANAGGTADELTGINVSITNTGTAGATYGIHIGDVTSGTQTAQAYSIYAADTNARNYFGGTSTFEKATTFSVSLSTPKISNLTTNGFVKTSGGDGTLGVGTASSDLAGVLSDETGTNKAVFSDSPTLVTPILGTPQSVTLTNGIGLPIGGITGLGTGIATWLGAAPTSATFATLVSDETGTNKVVFSDNPALVAPTATTIAIGSGTTINKILRGTVTVDPASINANTVSSQTFALSGAVAGDSLTVNPPAAGLTTGLTVLQCFVNTSDQITVVFQNTTGAPIDEASASWTYQIVR